MKIKNKNIVKEFEGLRLKAYQDVVGIWTIGYGDTRGVTKGMTITKEEAEKRLTERLKEFEGYVDEYVKAKLTQNQYDALVSLVYNIGPVNFRDSTLLKKLNATDYAGAADEFLRWNKAGVRGKLREIEGLTNRRKKERELFLEK